jgi:hypothetical protein
MTISASHTQQAKKKSVQEILEPRYDVQELFGILNPDIRQPLDMMEVLLRVVDDSRISEFKPQYGRGMITAWARIHGLFPDLYMPVGWQEIDIIRTFDRYNCEPTPGDTSKRVR